MHRSCVGRRRVEAQVDVGLGCEVYDDMDLVLSQALADGLLVLDIST